jgi:hypothetical protein
MKKTKGETNPAIKQKATPTEVATVEPGHINVQLSTDELAVLIQLLNFTKSSFIELARLADSQNDLDSQQIYSAREKVSEMLLAKFQSLAHIGEPESRNVH